MREIDLLPQWYKTNRRRQIRYRTEYVGLGLLVAMMGIWNFVASNSLTEALAKVTQAAPKVAEAEAISAQLAEVRENLALVRQRARTLEDIDSRIDVAAVLAELSFLTGRNVVLSEVDFQAESLNPPKQAAGSAFSAVRTKEPLGAKTESFGKLIWRLTIKGVASEAGDVYALTVRLEDSPYFNHVYPDFSRDRQMIPAAAFADSSERLSCFQIGCDLANYQEVVAKK
jgi:hypothetical protein